MTKIAIKILNRIISMKKTNIDSNRSHFNQKQEYHSPTRFPKKQFELIYREKEQLPSSEAYESIIFMKSKKCDKKQVMSSSKMAGKSQKQKTESLNKVLTKLSKELNKEQSHRNKTVDESYKGTVLKCKLNKVVHSKNESLDKVKGKLTQKLNKYQKAQIGAVDSNGKYKNIQSPSSFSKNKLSQQATMSTQFARTTQETFRKQTKSRNKKKKQNREPFNPTLYFDQPEEYVLLQNNFLQIDSKNAFRLDEKLFSRRDYFVDNKLSAFRDQRKNQEIEQPIIENKSTEQVFQEYLEYEDSTPSSRRNSAASEGLSNLKENGLNIVQNYFIEKIKIIQKWWRKMLLKAKKQPIQENKKLIQEEKAVIAADIVEQKPLENVSDFQSQQSYQFGQKIPEGVDLFNHSPIKMVGEISNGFQRSVGEFQAIVSRQNAAKSRKEAHGNILQKLLISKKISPQAYIERKEMIEARYYNELQEIEELKLILKSNACKAAEIEKKIVQDLNLIEKEGVQVDDVLLDKIFGSEFHADEEPKEILDQIPILQNANIIQREKSTGCHFDSDETVRASLYKKENSQEEYQQDFEEYAEDSSLSSQEKQFQSQKEENCEAMGGNLKQLFDEFKLREQLKMQIDKRAAIQMGIISQNIPAQIKDQFVSIDTSLNSIHRFILAFFKYYIFYYKFDFLRLINMPYGFNVDKRMRLLQGCTEEQYAEEDEDGVIYGLQSVIHEDIFEQFYQKVYQMGKGQMSSAKMANFQFEKIHNKSIFDGFNEALNFFRPYYLINGPPFPWTNSEKALTFYFIAEENIQQVFEKTQFKVLKWASTLCGIIVNKIPSPVQQISENESAQTIDTVYLKSNHPLLNQTREERLNKNQKLELDQKNHQWGILQNEKAMNNIQTAELIFNQLVTEICFQFFLSTEAKEEMANVVRTEISLQTEKIFE